MKQRLPAIILIGVFLVFGIAYLIVTFSGPKKKKGGVDPSSKDLPGQYKPEEPKFKKEGELWVLNSMRAGDTLGYFDIEIVDKDYEITQGLMYRKSMKKDRGMLFKFPDSRMRSFWMKNTHIPLDIIFIKTNGEIVNVQSNTRPFSEQSIPSTVPAQYVLEVNAGRALDLGWKPGDLIEWKENP